MREDIESRSVSWCTEILSKNMGRRFTMQEAFDRAKAVGYNVFDTGDMNTSRIYAMKENNE